MPPKGKGSKSASKPPVLSDSRALVPRGSRHISTKGNVGKRDEKPLEKPSTSRALVLRNGKHGAQGTGEMVAMGRLSGREKLELLAEDLIEKDKRAVAIPFKLDRCMKIARSQYDACLDHISNLQDVKLFYDEIKAELNARKTPGGPDPLRNANRVASTVATSIHNAYMLASAWKIVNDSLVHLYDSGLRDGSVRVQLRSDEALRARYLVLYDIIGVLVDAGQSRLRVLVTTTPHYSIYFKKVAGTDKNDPEMEFDWSELRKAYKSYMDSIILELCLPESATPKHILFQLLHDAVDEAPRESRRFPQAMFDAVGDLSVMLDLQKLLESPLTGDGQELLSLPRVMPEEYDAWVDAQLYSERAAQDTSRIRDFVYPLEKTQKSDGLKTLWKKIDENYRAVCESDIEDLWGLTGAFDRTPRWDVYRAPIDFELDSDSDGDAPKKSLRDKGDASGKKKPLAIADYADEDDSMPELQSVSDSSDDDEMWSDDEDDEDDDDDDDYSEDDGYDSEEEAEMKDMFREAMDTANGIPDFFDPANKAEMGDIPEDRKDNPFLKLLGSLRGRMFSANPNLKTTKRSEPRKGFGSAPPPRPAASSGGAASKPSGAPASRKVEIEEVEDEDNVAAAKKKKKKSKKKKKPAAATGEQTQEPEEAPATPPPGSPEPEMAIPTSPTPAPEAPAAAPTAAKKKKKKSSGSSAASTATLGSSAAPRPSVDTASTLPGMSTASLPLHETAAQSAHSYLRAEHLGDKKAKVKSRPDHATLFPIPEKKGGFLSRFTGNKDKPKDEGSTKNRSWFQRLRGKTKTYMHQLLRTSEDQTRGQAPMKWDHFVKVMQEMGFTYDPSTAGSSVRFDPPNGDVRSITFHKPHPDPTIHPMMLREFSKKLREYYGWTEEDFLL